jgi:hypothetical protein
MNTEQYNILKLVLFDVGLGNNNNGIRASDPIKTKPDRGGINIIHTDTRALVLPGEAALVCSNNTFARACILYTQ